MIDEDATRLKSVCIKIGSGATPRGGKEAYRGGNTSLIRSQNVYNDGFRKEGIVYIDDSQASELKNVEVLNGDVLLNITGDSVARCCQVDATILPARVNQHVAIIRPDPKFLDARYLHYVLVGHSFQEHLLSLASAGATRAALTKLMIENLEVYLPPLSEQKRVAGILGALDDKIELNRKMNETLEQIAHALFKSWFVDFDPVHAKAAGRQPAGMDKATADLFPDSFVDSELGKIPKGWRVGTLGEIGQNIRRAMQPEDIAPDTPYIGLEHMPRRSIALGEWADSTIIESSKSAFNKGDILFGKLRPYFHKVGIAPMDGICSTDILVITPKSSEWYGFLLCHSSSHELIRFTDKASTGTKMPRTSWNDISSFKIVIPTPQAANAFTCKAHSMVSRIQSNIFEVRMLAALRDSLMKRLISGSSTTR